MSRRCSVCVVTCVVLLHFDGPIKIAITRWILYYIHTCDDLSHSNASLPTSLVSSITYVMRCRRYVMMMTWQTRRIIEGIVVTVSMPHRFLYGSLLFSLFFCITHAPSSSILPIDRYCCAESFYEVRCIPITRETLSVVAVILKATVHEPWSTLDIFQLFGFLSLHLPAVQYKDEFFFASLYDGLRKRQWK